MLKKLLSLGLAVVMTLSMGTSAFATDQVSINSNYNVSVVEPTEHFQRGISIPSKEWDVTSKGEYEFAGTSNYQDLYTNYLITGKDRYSVTVTNDSDSKLTVKVKTRWTTYSTNTIASNDTVIFDVEGMKDDTNIYILFEGSYQDFSGSIG